MKIFSGPIQYKKRRPIKEHGLVAQDLNVRSYRTDGTAFEIGIDINERIFIFEFNREEAECLVSSLGKALKATKRRKL